MFAQQVEAKARTGGTEGAPDELTRSAARGRELAAMRTRIEQACRQAGYEPPVISTPNELLEGDYGNGNG